MKATIMIGVSGSGKSTWAKKCRAESIVVSADHYFTDQEGRYNFDPKKLGEAHGRCLREFVNTCQAGKDVLVDNTNTSVEEIAPYYAIAKAYGYEVEFVFIEFPWNHAAAENIHNVPNEVVKGQAKRIGGMMLPVRWQMEAKRILVDRATGREQQA